MNRVLLTGATGFIGRHCIEPLLSRGYDIHAVYTKRPIEVSHRVNWHKVDLMDSAQVSQLLNEVHPSHLLHLAWNVQPPHYWTSTENLRWLEASLSLIRAFAQAGGKRIVGAGTCAEYDWQDGYCNEESTPLLPATLYGACKHSLHVVLEAFAKEQGLIAAWGRIFFLYGPHEYCDRLVPSVIRSLLRNEPALCSSGEQVRDYLYIEDAAEAFVALLGSDFSGAINIARGKSIAVKDLIKLIGEQTNRSDLIKLGSIPGREGEPTLLSTDTRRLYKIVGWSPKYDLVKGVEKTIAWWKSELSK